MSLQSILVSDQGLSMFLRAEDLRCRVCAVDHSFAGGFSPWAAAAPPLRRLRDTVGDLHAFPLTAPVRIRKIVIWLFKVKR